MPICLSGFHSRLPHCNSKYLFQSITVRLHDSLEGFLEYKRELFKGFSPEEIRRKQKQEMIAHHKKIQDYLDRRYGESILAIPEIARILLDVIFKLDHKKYIVIAWSIMPNHIHLLLYMLTDNLSQCIQWIKSQSALLINRLRNTPGKKIWAVDYFDRYIRSYAHFLTAFNYIRNNPVKGNCSADFTGNIEGWEKYAESLME